MDRRDFLKYSGYAGLLTLTPNVAVQFAHAASIGKTYERLLILVELKGGNDGLNTVVPFADPEYYRLRPRLGIKREDVLQLDQRTGLHPQLKALLPIWQAQELAIIQGVGYPRPNLSHFRSIEIWDTASNSEQYLNDGWLARAFAQAPTPATFAADGVVIGSSELGPLAGGNARAIALANTEQFLRQARSVESSGTARNSAMSHILKVEADIVQAASGLNGTYSFRTEFPKSAFGNTVKTAAQVVASKGGVAVLRLTHEGFDTHQSQPGTHTRLLGELGEGLAALKSALVELGKWDSTLIFTYAEFGRRPAENASNGTDHGTAAAHFAIGGRVKGGLYGDVPRLSQLEGSNLVYTVDFRNLFATALDPWWGVDSTRVLGGRFAPLRILRV